MTIDAVWNWHGDGGGGATKASDGGVGAGMEKAAIPAQRGGRGPRTFRDDRGGGEGGHSHRDNHRW